MAQIATSGVPVETKQPFKKYILSLQLTDEERKAFTENTTSWANYALYISTLDKVQVMKMLRYLLVARPNNRTFLKRAIERINSLNRLTEEDLE